MQVLHKLRSPHVLQFEDWFETKNNVWLILEFCAGGDLHTVLQQDTREPESTVRLFAADILAGLQDVHAHGLLHNDLQPKNILMDGSGRLKLTGFTHACRVPDSVSDVHGSKRGAAPYRAPELFLDSGIPSYASDLWSLGTLLYELRFAKPAFNGASVGEVIAAVLNSEPHCMDQLSPELGGLTAALLCKVKGSFRSDSLSQM